MSALAAFIGNDLRMLYRTGYIWASVAVFGLLLLVALQASRLDFDGYEQFVAAIVLFDVVLSPVMLVGLMVLLERGEGAFAALCVTPAPRGFYLGARVLTVGFIAFAELMVLVLVVYDGPFSPVALMAGLLSAAFIAALFGFITVAPFDDLYAFVMPMIAAILFLGLPGYAVLLNLDAVWIAWHPTAGPLSLIEAAFEPTTSWSTWLFGLGGTGAWIVMAAFLARRAVGKLEARVGDA